MIIKTILGLFLSYLIGSFPTGYVAGKILKNIDIRDFGSGNMGATNVLRVLGKGPGALVLIIDIVKGAVPTVFLADMLGLSSNLHRVLFGLMAVAGHNWTVFLNFKGGKGIATGLGVLLGLTVKIVSLRGVFGLTIAVWLGVFLASGYVSLSSLAAATSLPLWMVVFGQPLELILLGIVFCIFVVIRHRSNIKRLLEGAEHRISLPFHKSKTSS